MDLNTELELSLYEELKCIHKSKKTEVILVCHTVSSKLYIKKVLNEYTIDVYENLKKLNSINIPEIIDIFETNDKLVIIEEYINGQTLQQILESKGPLDEGIVIDYMISLCKILDLLHNQIPPIIHRDIKPENIIISNDKVLKLIDFDIARIYKDGENLDTTLLGTKGYASPEQFGFEQSDGRSDIYAMGVMMNVLTTGKHCKECLNNSKLRNIILKCTELSPRDRYDNVSKLRVDLEQANQKSNKDIKLKSTSKESKKIIINNNLNTYSKNTSKTCKAKNYNNKSNKKSEGKVNIPGFRTNNKIKMIIASIFYLLLSTGLFAFTSISSLLGNLTLILMTLMYVILFTNYMGISNKLPLLKSNNILVKCFGFLLYSFIIFMGFGSILTLFT